MTGIKSESLNDSLNNQFKQIHKESFIHWFANKHLSSLRTKQVTVFMSESLNDSLNPFKHTDLLRNNTGDCLFEWVLKSQRLILLELCFLSH